MIENQVQVAVNHAVTQLGHMTSESHNRTGKHQYSSRTKNTFSYMTRRCEYTSKEHGIRGTRELMIV